MDNILQGDMKYVARADPDQYRIYLGGYHVTSDGSSLVFPTDSMGNQISDVSIDLINQIHQENILTGLYVDDLWKINSELSLNSGLRWDTLSAFLMAIRSVRP